VCQIGLDSNYVAKLNMKTQIYYIGFFARIYLLRRAVSVCLGIDHYLNESMLKLSSRRVMKFASFPTCKGSPIVFSKIKKNRYRYSIILRRRSNAIVVYSRFILTNSGFNLTNFIIPEAQSGTVKCSACFK